MTTNTLTIRVLIYSKATLFREGLKAMLAQGGAIQVIGEAATARQALRLAERLHPHVLLLELATSGVNGWEVTRRIKELDLQVQVLVLSLDTDDHLASDCLTAGAAGYIRKEAKPEELRTAIWDACGGAKYAA